MSLRSIQILTVEHRKVEEVVRQLENLIDDFLTSAEIPNASQRAFGEVGEFLTRTLALHLEKENHGLFPVLERFLPREAGPIAAMRDEHTSILRYLQGLRKGIQNLRQHPATLGPAAAQIRDHGRAFIDEVRRHIHKEERDLFPFVESHLSAECDREIVTKFDDSDAGPPMGEVAPQRT